MTTLKPRKFKHHSYFAKEKHIQSYLYPYVCFSCRLSFKKPFREEARICPCCQGMLVKLGRKFKVPKRSNIRGWHIVKQMLAQGARF
jgi:hypothetical protein